jgi:hypothetical protein
MFITPYDIANRALQHLGVPRITSFTQDSKQSVECGFVYDKLRRAELTKSVWSFAVRRAVLRKIVVGTSKLLTPAAWAVGTTYAIFDVVKYDNMYWISNQASNLANTPGVGGLAPPWSLYNGPLIAQAYDAAVAYIPGDLLFVTTTAYINTQAITGTSPPNTSYWQPMTGSVATFLLNSPVGYPKNPVAATVPRNLYRLPANFVRIAPMDAKVAGNVRSNTTAGMQFNDYEFEGDFMLSAYQGTTQADPLVMRFVTDFNDVPTMDTLFCEALAARMATELAEMLTQSEEKKKAAIVLYDNAVNLAKNINAIEAGTTEPEMNAPVAPPQGQRNG